MIVTPIHCVVDARVAVKLIIHEADSQFANELLRTRQPVSRRLS